MVSMVPLDRLTPVTCEPDNRSQPRSVIVSDLTGRGNCIDQPGKGDLMTAIRQIEGRMVLDSRGFPTLEGECVLEDGSRGLAMVPSGASTGDAEALELRDGGSHWGGKGVEKALMNLRGEISDLLLGCDALDQQAIDQRLCEADGTDNKSRFGANATLAISMVVCRAAARSRGLPLYRHIDRTNRRGCRSL